MDEQDFIMELYGTMEHLGYNGNFTNQKYSFDDCEEIARHFYNLGASEK